jgi:hypothetical protein
MESKRSPLIISVELVYIIGDRTLIILAAGLLR